MGHIVTMMVQRDTLVNNNNNRGDAFRRPLPHFLIKITQSNTSRGSLDEVLYGSQYLKNDFGNILSPIVFDDDLNFEKVFPRGERSMDKGFEGRNTQPFV